MDQHKKWGAVLLLALGLVLAGLWSLHGIGPETPVDWGTLCSYGDPRERGTKIDVLTVEKENILVLPATVSPEAVSLHFDGAEQSGVTVTGDLASARVRSGDVLDLTKLCTEGRYDLTLEADGAGSEYTLKLAFADQLRTMYLLSDDPEDQGRSWVEASEDKSNKATGSMVLQNADGSIVYQDALTQLKGRGNSTWKADKKPYQIKLHKKTDLLQTGRAENAAKTWVLLSNFSDMSLMRNTLIYNLGRALGMESCTENDWVNLYYDGEFRGCYLLCEKVEIGPGRVDITDLEEINEAVNDGVELDKLPVQTGRTENGAVYRYCAGMKTLGDVSGGYLLELEIYTRVADETCYFTTTRGQNVVVKSPEFASREQMDYIATLYQEWEDAIYHDGVNPDTGKAHSDYVDLRSAAICYLANEIAKNQDAFRTSAYLYKDSGEDRMYMGPLWDYDVTLNYNGRMRPTGFDTVRTAMGAALCDLGDFREMVREVYLSEVWPVMTEEILSDSGSMGRYKEQLRTSVACNTLLWPNTANWEEEVDLLWTFLSERADYLRTEIAKWTADGPLVLTDNHFADVAENAWYFRDVHKAAEYGLMAGGGGDAFYPNNRAIRAHVLQVIYNMVGKPLVEFRDDYSDVKQSDEFANAVSWALQNGVLTAAPGALFGPMEEVPREEVAQLLYRCQGGGSMNPMDWAVQEGLIDGVNGQLPPTEPITRAELASMLVRYYEKYVMAG